VLFRLLNPCNWFGPLFRFELVRLARRGLHIPLRCVLGLVLLLVMLVFYLKWFPRTSPASLLLGSTTLISHAEITGFTESFVFALLTMQLAVVVLLTPILAAGSITEEYQKQTIGFLLASPLSTREIILGKLAARLAYVLGTLLMFLPVMALMQMWGGVEMVQLLAGYIVIVFSTFSLGGLSVYFAVSTRSLSQTLFQVYAIVVSFSVGTLCFACLSPILTAVSPFAALWLIFNEWGKNSGAIQAGAIFLFAVFHCIPLVWGIFAAKGQLRRSIRLRERIAADHLDQLRNKVPAPADQPLPDNANTAIDPPIQALGMTIVEAAALPSPVPERMIAGDTARPRRPNARRNWSYIGDQDPLLWKEMYFPRIADIFSFRSATASVIYGFAVIIGTCALTALYAATVGMLVEAHSIAPLYNQIVRWFGLLGLCGWILAAGLRAAASVAREREKQTLESLLTLPVPRREILLAKWNSCLLCGKEFRIVLAILAGLGCITLGLSLFAVVPAAVFIFIVRYFAISLGLWLSTICRSVLRATAWFIVLLALLSVCPPALAELASAVARRSSDTGTALTIEKFVSDMNPISCWIAFTFSWRELGHDGAKIELRLLSASLSTLLIFILSGLLWSDACRRFEREE